MTLNCTIDEVKAMAALAINNSKPVGLGILHYRPDDIAHSDDIQILHGNVISIDYWNGRIVKFYARQEGEYSWHFNPDVPSFNYQSWSMNYRTYEKLLEEVRSLKGEIK